MCLLVWFLFLRQRFFSLWMMAKYSVPSSSIYLYCFIFVWLYLPDGQKWNWWTNKLQTERVMEWCEWKWYMSSLWNGHPCSFFNFISENIKMVDLQHILEDGDYKNWNIIDFNSEARILSVPETNAIAEVCVCISSPFHLPPPIFFLWSRKARITPDEQVPSKW